MNKRELISAIAEKTGISKKDTEKTMQAFADCVTDALSAGDRVVIMGFGAFDVKRRPARSGRNPATGEPIEIPASASPVFKAGKGLREAVE